MKWPWQKTPDRVTVTQRGRSSWHVSWRDVTYDMDMSFSYGQEFRELVAPVLAVNHTVIAYKMIKGSKQAATRRDREHLIAVLKQDLPGTVTIGPRGTR